MNSNSEILASPILSSRTGRTTASSHSLKVTGPHREIPPPVIISNQFTPKSSRGGSLNLALKDVAHRGRGGGPGRRMRRCAGLMRIYLSLSIYLSISLSLSIYIYIYI